VDHRQRRSDAGEETVKILPFALLLVLAAPPARAAEPIGRLFYTPDQRGQLDAARAKRARTGTDKAEDAPRPSTPEVVTYGGIVRRSDGKTTVWLNNRAVTERESAGARMVGRVRSDGTVVLQSAQTGRNVPLRVGQRADLLSGRVDEGYRRVAPKAEDKDVAGLRPAPELAAATEAEHRRKDERERQENVDDAFRAMRDAAQSRPTATPPPLLAPGMAQTTPQGIVVVPAPVPIPTPVQPYQ
jgi:hypothetical protein